MKEKLNSLQELNKVKSVKQEDVYVSKMYKWRSVISRKNKKWFDSKPNVNNIDLEKSDANIYKTIKTLFEDDKTRNWMIHLATNFLPLNNPSQCPILPAEKCFCKFSGDELTDMMRIKTGDRNKAMGYVGLKSNVILSADAIRELYRYVYYNIVNFDTKIGHIVNHAFDDIRLEETSQEPKK
jgi:hypothetical protein